MSSIFFQANIDLGCLVASRWLGDVYMRHVQVSAVLPTVFSQAEDVIRDLVRSRGLGDVYKRQVCTRMPSGTTVRGMPPKKIGAPLAVPPKLSPASFLSLIHI